MKTNAKIICYVKACVSLLIVTILLLPTTPALFTGTQTIANTDLGKNKGDTRGTIFSDDFNDGDLGTSLSEGHHTYAFVANNGVLKTTTPKHDGPFVHATYSAVDIGALPEKPASFAYGINNHGDVVGSSGEEYGLQEAFLWQQGTMTGLGMLSPDHLWSEARAINNIGTIVGSSHAQACMWKDGIITNLGSLNGSGNVAYTTDINNQEQIVGYSYLEPHQWQPPHAFLYQNGVMTDVGILPGTTGSKANAINDEGVVVGTSSSTDANGTHNHAFIYTQTQGIQQLPTGYINDEAIDINNQAMIIGNAATTTGSIAYLYDDGVITTLGSLGGTKTFAHALNNTGTIVGSSCITGNTAMHAFLYENGMMTDLNTLIPQDSGWTLVEAYDINDDGAIVGYGYNPSGELRGFLLQPYSVPWVWITDPMATEFWYEEDWHIAPIKDSPVYVRAIDLNHGQIINTSFSYSANNGIDWIDIGYDTYGGFKGYLFAEGQNRKMGDEGWSIFWNISLLSEGKYLLKATMTDTVGGVSENIRSVYIDRNQPTTTITNPVYGAALAGTYPFMFFNTGDHLSTLELFMVGTPPAKTKSNESSSNHQQTGVGSVKQGDVGPNCGLDGKNRWCGPTAAANALAQLKDNRIYPPGQTGNDTAVAKELCKDFNTTCCHGTVPWRNINGSNTTIETDNVGAGIKAYLERRGIGCSNNNSGYDVKTYGTKAKNNSGTWNPVEGSNEITYQKYYDEIRRNQSVILYIAPVDEGPDGKVGTGDDNISKGGHFITGKGADIEPIGTAGEEQTPIYGFDQVDPVDGQEHSELWTDPPNENGFSSVFYNGNDYLILGMWAISPKNTTQWGAYKFESQPDVSEEMLIHVDTTQFSDGYHTIIAQISDTDGFIATETITVQIDNTQPTCNIYPFGGLISPFDHITIMADDGVGSGIHHLHIDIFSQHYPPVSIPSVFNSTYEFTLSQFGMTYGWVHVNAFAVDNASNPSGFAHAEYLLEFSGPPKVSIADPAGTGILYDYSWKRRIISEPVIKMQAFDTSFTGTIMHTIFEYSNNGIDWHHIGTDTFGGFDGYLLPEGQNRKFGSEGWSSSWDLTGQPEGLYLLKATMDSDLGEHAETIQEVYYDPVPPLPKILYPQSLQPIRGTIDFIITSSAPDGISLELLLYEFATDEKQRQPGGWFTQPNLGSTQQGEVGPDGDDGVNRWCTPTAAANALAGQNDPRLYPPGQNGNETALAKAIAARAGTDKNKGTNSWQQANDANPLEGKTDHFGAALRQYLNDSNIGCNNSEGYEVTTYGIRVLFNAIVQGLYPIAGSNTVTFEAYNEELRKGQAIVLAIMNVNVGPDGNPYTDDDYLQGGHALTGRGANSTANPDGSHTISYVDPEDGQPEEENWESHNGFSYLNYNFDYYMITGMWAISKKNQTAVASCVYFDDDPNDGLMVSLDTQTVPDGYHTLQVLLTDENNVVGTDTVVVYVDNTPPTSVIQPLGGPIQAFQPIWIHASDEGSGVYSISYELWHNGVLTITGNYFESDVEIILASFGILSGVVEIHYWVTDNAGNSYFDIQTYSVIPEGDTTAPTSIIIPPGSSYLPGLPIPAFQPIHIFASDEEGGSGIQYIHVEIYQYGIPEPKFNQNIFSEFFEFTFQQHGIVLGIAKVIFYAVDNAENCEVYHEMYYQVLPGKNPRYNLKPINRLYNIT